MQEEPHIFAARIARMESGVVTHYIPVPPEIAEDYIEADTRRLIATLNGNEIRRYLFQSANGEYGLVIGKSVIRDLGLPMIEPIMVELRADPDPDRVELCEELEVALEQDDAAGERFYNMTPGKQRGLALHVCRAKRTSTRVRRALDVCEKLRTHTLYGDRNA